MPSSFLCLHRRGGVAAAALLPAERRMARAPDQQSLARISRMLCQPTQRFIQQQGDVQTNTDKSKAEADKRCGR
jgi:hypothetical protein